MSDNRYSVINACKRSLEMSHLCPIEMSHFPFSVTLFVLFLLRAISNVLLRVLRLEIDCE
jgi:hypothetical protein